MKSRKRLTVVAIATSFLFVSASPAFAGSINGSGATFAAPLVDACKGDFTKTLATQSIILVVDPVRVVQISQATSLILLTQMHHILQVHQLT